MIEQVLTSIVTVITSTVITLAFNGVIKLSKKKRQAEIDKEKTAEEDRRLLKKGIQSLLKNDLKVRYDYWINEGYAPEDAKDDLEDEYKIYHALGKNGVMDSRREKVLRLPNERPESK